MTKFIAIDGSINMAVAFAISEIMLHDDVEILETEFSAPMRIEMPSPRERDPVFDMPRYYHRDLHRPRDLYKK